MLVNRYVPETVGPMRWVVVFAIVVTSAAVAHGQAVISSPPKLLPPIIRKLAKPMPATTPAAVVPKQVVKQSRATLPDERCEQLMGLHAAIESLIEGDPSEAVEHWSSVELSGDAEIWRHVALSVALLRSGELDGADDALVVARKFDPDNAVIHYLGGMMLTVRASIVDEPSKEKNGLSQIYESMAIKELREAIEVAHRIPWNQPIGPEGSVGSPTVYELLAALKLERVVAKSHLALGLIHLDADSFNDAERNMDDAAALGLRVGASFRDLAEKYEKAGMHRDAARAYLKSVTYGKAKAAPALKVLQSLRNAVFSR